MNTTHINYQEYLESYAWKALKKTKLEEQSDCECCWAPATSVHHLSYDRLWREKSEDIVSICERCHDECHHVGGYQIKNDEEILRRRFDEVKGVFWENENNEFIQVWEDYFLNWEKLHKILDCSVIIFEDIRNSWFNHNEINALLKSKKNIYCLQNNIYGEEESQWTSYSESDNLVKMSNIWEYSVGCQWGDATTILNQIHIDYDSFKLVPSIEGSNFIYMKDKDNVYCDFVKVEWADPATFEVIHLNQPWYENNWLSKDKNYLYYCWNKIEWSDSSTFEILNRKYSKDKNYVYFNYKKIEWSDGSTFELLSEEYSRDKNNVYFYENQSVSRELFRLEWADPKSFEILERNAYSKDRNSVYYNGEKIEWSDGSTFELLNENYSKDKNNVYYTENTIYSRELSRLEWADLKSFEILQEGYSKDRNFVYQNGKKIWFDGWTFIIINKWYIKDKDNVYYLSCNKVEWADPATFEPIDGCYAKDKDNIYYNHIRLDGIKSDDYKIIDDYKQYIANKNYVYYRRWRIEWADSASFSWFKESSWYAKDKNFVYRDEKIIDWADPENFHEVLKKLKEEDDETQRFYNLK